MWRITAAAAALTLLLACSSDDSVDDTQPDDSTDMAEAAAAAGIPPKPDQATADAYIAALVAINPGIVYRGTATDGDVDTAINRGRDQCSTIQANPDDRAQQLESTKVRFSSPDAPQGWDPATTERILDVVHQYLCPT